jgi:hypothetical protein
MLTAALALLSVSGCTGSTKTASIALKPFDYSFAQYDRLLHEYVSEGWVDYVGLKAQRALLDSVVSSIGSADLTRATREEKLAFYINAYNALTLRSIVDHYPIRSIKDISGVWDKIEWAVAGTQLTLGQIEHEILRKQFNEPRIHSAIVCASISCPPLQSRAYLPDSLNVQLDKAVRSFVLSPARNRLDSPKAKAELSAIFKWFGEDFVPAYYDSSDFRSLSKEKNAALNFVIDYYPQTEQAGLRSTSFDVSYGDYDWSLNERK